MPPALAASSRQQQEFDYDFERQVLASDASTSFAAFLAKSEVCYASSNGPRKITTVL